jgi:polysaccharide export outer membrane protein
VSRSFIKGTMTGLRFAALLLFTLSLVMPALTPAMAQDAADPSASASSASTTSADYVLGTGDKLKVIVFGEESLSGDFEVSSTGIVSMPLVGEIAASGKTIAQFQSALASTLASGYLRDPRVSVQVQNYRPFFILGEVMKPGSYTYVNGMTVITAVAMAGGYSYRADEDGILLKRGPEAKESPVKEEDPVQPGDVIRVPERFF